MPAEIFLPFDCCWLFVRWQAKKSSIGALQSKKYEVKNKKRPWEQNVKASNSMTVTAVTAEGEHGWGPPYTRPACVDFNACHPAGVLLPCDPVAQIAVGKGHALLSTASGKLFCWGELNDSGQLGLAQAEGRAVGRFPPASVPQLNTTLSLHPYSTRPVIAVAAGTSHSAAIVADGIAYTWGYVRVRHAIARPLLPLCLALEFAVPA